VTIGRPLGGIVPMHIHERQSTAPTCSDHRSPARRHCPDAYPWTAKHCTDQHEV